MVVLISPVSPLIASNNILQLYANLYRTPAYRGLSAAGSGVKGDFADINVFPAN